MTNDLQETALNLIWQANRLQHNIVNGFMSYAEIEAAEDLELINVTQEIQG